MVVIEIRDDLLVLRDGAVEQDVPRASVGGNPSFLHLGAQVYALPGGGLSLDIADLYGGGSNGAQNPGN